MWDSTRNKVAIRRDELLRRNFQRLERLGIHAVPRYWMEPIPDSQYLTDAVFNRIDELVGIDLRVEEQLKLLASFMSAFEHEYAALNESSGSANGFHLNNGSFGSVDAEILHCMMRWLKPRQVIEIGVGWSTLVTSNALALNRLDGKTNDIVHIGIDPVPGAIAWGAKGFELQKASVQDIDLSLFTGLADGDVLFIDSSHVLATGSDVAFEYSQILPRLSPGVVVHIHDIFLPREYPRQWLRENLWFPNEQYLLQALLTDNSKYEVLWAGNYMASTYPEQVTGTFPSFDPLSVSPGSFWIRRTGTSISELP